MAEVKYTLQYLPTFYTDLEEHVMYISHVLKNVQAANELTMLKMLFLTGFLSQNLSSFIIQGKNVRIRITGYM